MKHEPTSIPKGRAAEFLRDWIKEQKVPTLCVLSTLLDAHLIYGEKGIPGQALRPLFEVWWPEVSLDRTLEDLIDMRFLTSSQETTYAVSESVCRPLAVELGRNLADHRFNLPDDDLSFKELLAGFTTYTKAEAPGVVPAKGERALWAASTYTSVHRTHHVLVRPYPLRLQAHEDEYMLILSNLTDPGMETIAKAFARSRALRQRLGLYDLERAEKINISRSEVFVSFERYLRRVHGLRIGAASALSQSLEDSGILSLRMG